MTDNPFTTATSANNKLVERYTAVTDKTKLGPLFAENVDWVEWADGVPGSGAITRGKEAVIQNYGEDELRSRITRLTEQNDVVVAEGTAHFVKKDGRSFTVQFCDTFEVENGRITWKSSFGALIKDSS